MRRTLIVLLIGTVGCRWKSPSASIREALANLPVASVQVIPPAATLPVGESLQLFVVVRDAFGNTLTGRTVTWESTPSATVTETGLVTGAANGIATVKATSEGRSGTATLTVGPRVASVTVTPATALVQVGHTLQLAATPKDADGNALSRAAWWISSNDAKATVSVWGGLVTGVTVGPVTIAANSEGAGGTAAVTVVSVADHISVTYPMMLPPQTWVLVDGRSSVQCENDLLSTGINTANPADFTVVNMSTDAACKAEVAVFASDHAAVLDLNPAFTAESNVIPETLGGPVPLEVNLWVVSDASAAEVEGDLQPLFLRTQALWVENHLGVELRLPLGDGTWAPLTTWTFPATRLIPSSDARAGTIGSTCTQSGMNTLQAAPSLYDSGRLNMYVVENVAGQVGIYEWLCVYGETLQVLTGGENVIYFSRKHHLDASLAHVLGHALSLIDKPLGVRADGHTGSNEGGLITPLPGFTSDNVMWTGLTMGVDDPPNTFTLGQVYRMALDKRSWLNKSGPHTKICPDSPSGDIQCPPLVFGW